ncbi:hypothetical protein HOY82DRAFT_542495 [Tuber indicum]|nr:hypothetical protein HOY82DRAFT_542495 [Tuber indicum]
MASKTPSTSSISEIKEPALYKLDEKPSSVCGEEKAVDSEDAFAKETWNNPAVNKYRLFSCFALFIAGSLFFSAYGVSSTPSIMSIAQATQVHEANTTPQVILPQVNSSPHEFFGAK